MLREAMVGKALRGVATVTRPAPARSAALAAMAAAPEPQRRKEAADA